MIERTRGMVIVLADHSKWGVVSNFEVASLDQVHKLVTDKKLAPSAFAELAARSVEVIIAGDREGADGSVGLTGRAPG